MEEMDAETRRQYLAEFDEQHRRATIHFLSKMSQTSTVADLQAEFEDLMHGVIGLFEPLVISYFISALLPEIQREMLRLRRPTTLLETFTPARSCEARVEVRHSDLPVASPIHQSPINHPKTTLMTSIPGPPSSTTTPPPSTVPPPPPLHAPVAISNLPPPPSGNTALPNPCPPPIPLTTLSKTTLSTSLIPQPNEPPIAIQSTSLSEPLKPIQTSGSLFPIMPSTILSPDPFPLPHSSPDPPPSQTHHPPDPPLPDPPLDERDQDLVEPREASDTSSEGKPGDVEEIDEGRTSAGHAQQHRQRHQQLVRDSRGGGVEKPETGTISSHTGMRSQPSKGLIRTIHAIITDHIRALRIGSQENAGYCHVELVMMVFYPSPPADLLNGLQLISSNANAFYPVGSIESTVFPERRSIFTEKIEPDPDPIITRKDWSNSGSAASAKERGLASLLEK